MFATKHGGTDVQERAEADGPEQAFQWRQLSWRDENGRIAIDGLETARQQILGLAKRSKKSPGSDGWTELGPSNVPGRCRSLVVNPTDPNILWLGTVGGGIWKSTDGGSNWAPVSDRLANLSIGCMAIDPVDPSIMYAGTGEGYYNSDYLQGGGILKTVDGGVNWSLLPSTTGFSPVNRIAVSPANHNIVLIADNSIGIRKSSDGGAGWTTVYAAPGGYGSIMVAFNPSDPTKAIASSRLYSSGWYNVCLYSTNSGDTWTESNLKMKGFYSRFELAYAPSSPSTVYANGGNPFNDGTYSGTSIYRSIDGGANYSFRSQANTDATKENQGWYDNHIWVDPTNPNFLVTANTAMFKSTDGGATTSMIADGYTNGSQPHPDMHFLVSRPGFNGTTDRRLYLLTDGGPYYNDNIYTASLTGAGGWVKIGNGVRSTQFYGAIGDQPTGVVMGGTQDNGTPFFSIGNQTAGSLAGGDGGWVAMDPADPTVRFGEHFNLYLWRYIGNSGVYIYGGLPEAGTGTSNFIAPFILDPNNATRLLAGGSQLWRTNDNRAGSVAFSSIKAASTAPISAIAVAPGNSDIIWVGHNDGKVYKTTNGTAATPTWTAVDDNSTTNPLPAQYIGRILIDPADSNKVYVALGGFTANNLRVTTNGGTSFSSASGSGVTALPSAPAHTIARDPANANHLFVGLEVGVCESLDGGSTWSAPTVGPLNVSVDELRFMNNGTKLLAATHGRGIWVLGGAGVSSVSGPAHITAGSGGIMTLVLDSIASAGGVNVSVSSDNAALTVPSPVNVPQGSTSTTFNVTANAVATPTDVTVTATVNGSTKTCVVTVDPAAPTVLDHATTTLASLYGGAGNTANFKVYLKNPAPTGGLTVNLTSSDSAAGSLPATLLIPAGQTYKGVPIADFPVAADETVTFTATYGTESVSASMLIKAAVPKTMTVSPNNVVGGSVTVVTGKVTLTAPAPTGGALVTLTTSNSAQATVPANVTVPAGATFATFPVTHYSVSGVKVPSIKGTLLGITRSAGLTLNPPQPKVLNTNNNQVKGGSSTVITGTVTLNAPAPAGGWVVTLSSDTPSAAEVPATVTVAAGATQATFTVTHHVVTTQTIVTLSATAGGATKTKQLTVNP